MATRLKVLFAVTIICLFPPRDAHPQSISLTDSLTNAFHCKWNENDLDGMLSLLLPDAFFKSPHQMRYGRSTMAVTVLKQNPPIIRDCRSEESHSRVESALAWSIGKLYCNLYFRESDRVRRELFTDADSSMTKTAI